MARFYATLAAGLEPVVVGEIREKLPSATLLRACHGKALFDYEGPPKHVRKLLTVDAGYVFLAEFAGFPFDRGALDDFREYATYLPLEEAVRLVGIADKAPPFRVTVTRRGRHSYRSHEVAAAVGAGISSAFGWPVDLKHFAVEIGVEIRSDAAIVGVKFAGWGKHPYVAAGRTALRPSVAHCLLRLAVLKPGQLCVDPLCGTGVILIEGAATHSKCRYVGGDVSAAALTSAAANVAAAGAPVSLVNWDARRLPLREASADRFVTNLPFGRRSGSHPSNRRLYPALFAEVERVLVPGGRAVVLSLEKRLVNAALLRRQGLLVEASYAADISGLGAAVYVLQRR